MRGDARVALLSDRSFQSYATARAHLREPKLPLDTDLYWNQGFLDVELEYPITSPRADCSVRVNVAPELGQRVKLHLEFLPIGRPPRVYDLPGRSWRMPLDPRWYEAAWTFARSGFVVPFALDRLVFLVCLAAPFRQFWRLLAVVMALTLLQGASLTASALGATPDTRLLTPLYETCVAAVVVLLAIENVGAPRLRRRWLIASVVGVLSGLHGGQRLAHDGQVPGGSVRRPRGRYRFESPTNRTGSLPLSASGVIVHVPPQAAVATLPAVWVPPNGSVNALVTAPTTQKPVLNGAYSSVVNTLPAPYATSCEADCAASA